MGEGYAMSIAERASAGIQPPAKHNSNGRMITDDELEKALDWLRDNAKVLGEAKKRVVKAGHMIKHAEAVGFIQSTQKGADARKYEARTTEQYLKWIDEESEAAGEYERLKALREAAALKIEAWRSEQANFRAMKI